MLRRKKLPKDVLTTQFAQGETEFHRLALPKANLRAISLPFVKFIDSDLQAADLSQIFMPGAEFIRTRLAHSNLKGANLIGAVLLRASLQGACLERAMLGSAQLAGVDLSHADLRHASLNGANLSGANLRGANLQGANLKRADLRGAVLLGANLQGAILNEANLFCTTMPDGTYQDQETSASSLSTDPAICKAA